MPPQQPDKFRQTFGEAVSPSASRAVLPGEPSDKTGRVSVDTVASQVGLPAAARVLCSVSNSREEPLFIDLEHRVAGICVRTAAVESKRTHQDGMLVVATPDKKLHLLTVDGIGGFLHGDYAAHSVVEAAKHLILNERDVIEIPTLAVKGMERLREVRTTHKPSIGAAYALASIDLETGVCKCQHQGDVQILQVTAAGKENFLSKEHHAARMMLDRGIKAKDIAPSFYHMLHNLVGIEEGVSKQYAPEINTRRLFHEDRIIVASDGLFDLIPPKEVAALSARITSTSELISELKKIAKDLIEKSSGKNDNFTILIYEHVGEREASRFSIREFAESFFRKA